MTDKELADCIVSSLRPVLDGFLSEKSEEEVRFDAELDRIRGRMEGESDAVIRSALEDGLRAQEKRRPDSKGRQEAAAKAFVAAGTRLGLSAAGTTAPKARERKRTSRAQAKEAAEAMVKVLARGDLKTKADLISEAGLSDDVGGSALARLKRAGRLESNGQRGRGAAYRLAQP
ncbi:MAG: hypothetical protein O2992_09145 [Gemmatimonadetes bacterium]|nr:hypothetical protein [Gemmatimonadota bacterium]